MLSRTVDIDGPVHYHDFGGSGPPLVCVHGLGGAAINWMAVGHELGRRYRVLAPDLRGFGETPLGNRDSTIDSNQRLLDRFIREVAGSAAVLVGNSMGGLLSTLQAARHPEKRCGPGRPGIALAPPAAPRRSDLDLLRRHTRPGPGRVAAAAPQSASGTRPNRRSDPGHLHCGPLKGSGACPGGSPGAGTAPRGPCRR
ncbi:MAG: alpha/beta hydrolase [Candidatus Dormibacteraeota bacterium]|nr:alpha/beta hydrolase [Candidatus Dormibacteraeota bacterium]